MTNVEYIYLMTTNGTCCSQPSAPSQPLKVKLHWNSSPGDHVIILPPFNKFFRIQEMTQRLTRGQRWIGFRRLNTQVSLWVFKANMTSQFAERRNRSGGFCVCREVHACYELLLSSSSSYSYIAHFLLHPPPSPHSYRIPTYARRQIQTFTVSHPSTCLHQCRAETQHFKLYENK